MEFSRHYQFRVNVIGETLTLPTFHYVLSLMCRHYENMKMQKRELTAKHSSQRYHSVASLACVCMYVCMQHKFVSVCLCMYLSVCMRMIMYMYVCVCVCVCTSVCVMIYYYFHVKRDYLYSQCTCVVRLLVISSM